MREIEVSRDHGPVDLKEIENFEKLIGYRFPEIYRDILSKHNALYPRTPDFKFFDRVSGQHIFRDVTFYGFGDSLPTYLQIDRAQDMDAYGHEGLVIFGTSANGDYVCFDYSSDPRTDNPKVVAMFHDYPDENDKMLVNFVASSFEEFLDLLQKVDSLPPLEN